MSYRLGVDVGGTTMATNAILEARDRYPGHRQGVYVGLGPGHRHRRHSARLPPHRGPRRLRRRTPAIHDANIADLRAKYADTATLGAASGRLTRGWPAS